MTIYTNDDFERLSWHDNLIYGVRMDVGDPDLDQWHSNLILDIDFIADWLRGKETFEFLVAPATLTFHDVTDFKLTVDHGDSEMRTALNEWSIHAVHRALVANNPRDGYPPRTYFRWRIELNWPHGGELSFGASGFTQDLRADPIRIGQQRLVAADRPPIM